jgi:hypothetical protein
MEKKGIKKSILIILISCILVLAILIAVVIINIYIPTNEQNDNEKYAHIPSPDRNGLRSELESSGEKFLIDSSEIEIKGTDRIRSYYVLKNIYTEEKTFSLEARCVEAFVDNADPSDIKFKLLEKMTLQQNETIVHAFEISAKEYAVETYYSCEINVMDGNALYAKETFNVALI